MMAHAFWRRLDVPGHDAARAFASDDGWRLEGTAVFSHDRGPAALTYEVAMRTDGSAARGRVSGFVAGWDVRHDIRRTPDGWTLNGRPQGLAELVDLDFGFTPATNLQQLRRLNLEVGARVAFSVAWLDINSDRLEPLVQIYRRTSATTYAYEAPDVGYTAVLEMAETGFVRSYPGLWAMEPDP